MFCVAIHLCYILHHKFSEVETSYSKTTLFVMSLSVDVSNGNNATECLREQAIHTCYPGNWSGFIHMMALSSVIKLPVFSVYPESSPAIRSFFHGLIRPRNVDTSFCNGLVHIMFTRANLDNKQGAVFQPNHFCPLFRSANTGGITAFNGNCASIQMSSLVPDVQSAKEFPPLGSEKKNRKSDIRSFFKHPKKKTAYKNPFLLKTNKDENGCVSSRKSMPHLNNLSTSDQCPDRKRSSTKSSDTIFELSTKYLSRLWYNRHGQTCLYEGKNEVWNLSLPGLSREWYSNVSHRDDAMPTLENSAESLSERNVTNNTQPFEKNTDIQLTLNVLSADWYAGRGRLAAKNWGRLSRKEIQENVGGLKFSCVRGSIDENIQNILNEQSQTT